MFLRAGLQYDLYPEAHLQPQHEQRWADEDDSTAMTTTTPRERGAVTGLARSPSTTRQPGGRWCVAAWALRDNSMEGRW
jgi:hypothetical protein